MVSTILSFTFQFISVSFEPVFLTLKCKVSFLLVLCFFFNKFLERRKKDYVLFNYFPYFPFHVDVGEQIRS